MLLPLAIGTAIYAGMLVILCIGFTFTYMMEKFPNFAHTSYAVIGTMLTYAMVRIYGCNPYTTWVPASLLGGCLGVALYLLVVRPIKSVGSGSITLSFAMFAIASVIGSVLAIFSYWVLMSQGYRTGSFLLRSYDFKYMGYPGVMLVAPITCVALVVGLRLFFTRVTYGIAMRATAEDEKLASALGVNTFRVHVTSWFMSGALASLAGAILPLWQPTSLDMTDTLLVSVMAGSVVGGLDEIYGAIVGGLAVALAERVLPSLLMKFVGVWIGGYEGLTPILFIFFVLMLNPGGIMGTLRSPRSPIRRLLRLMRPAGEGSGG